MRDGLHEVGNRRTLAVPLPLDAERIALMVTHRGFQMEEIDFPFKASRCRNANMIELHSGRLPRISREQRLTAEHVPPQNIGGKKMLPTCGIVRDDA